MALGSARLTKRLCFRASLFSLLGIATALIAIFFKGFVPASADSDRCRCGGQDLGDHCLQYARRHNLLPKHNGLSLQCCQQRGDATCNYLGYGRLHDAEWLGDVHRLVLFSLVGIIALSTGANGAQGRVGLFTVTIGVVILP